jgi:hypothetical protein
MPVRSLNSSVMRWPSRAEVDRAARDWVATTVVADANVLAAGYLGSYARDQAGIGSDLDWVMVVSHSDEPFHRRSLEWRFDPIPVPVEPLVYTRTAWERLAMASTRMYRTLMAETVWIKPSAIIQPCDQASPTRL